MIVHCPSCSTGYHLAPPPPSAVLRCSRCREVVPSPAARRHYVVIPRGTPPTPPASAEVAVRGAVAVPTPPTPVSPPAMQALDASLFAPERARASLPPESAPSRPSPRIVEVDEGTGAAALVPLGLAAVGAAAAWFAAPRLVPWIPSLPFAFEPWMLGAAGAVCGLLLGWVWQAWRAARR